MKRKLILVFALAVTGACIFLSSCEKDNKKDRDTICTCDYDDGYYTGRFVVNLEYEDAYELGIYTCEELSYYLGPYYYCE